MSIENILHPNNDNLFCHELTCDIFSLSGALNFSGSINITGSAIGGNLTVSNNITAQGLIYGNGVFSNIDIINASAANATLGSTDLADSINYLTGNNLGSVTFSMPTAGDIITDNSLSNLPDGSTFTFLLGNLATGTSYLTLANSSDNSTVVKPNIYLPINASGTTFRTCTAVINSVSTPQIDIY